MVKFLWLHNYHTILGITGFGPADFEILLFINYVYRHLQPVPARFEMVWIVTDFHAINHKLELQYCNVGLMSTHVVLAS